MHLKRLIPFLITLAATSCGGYEPELTETTTAELTALTCSSKIETSSGVVDSQGQCYSSASITFRCRSGQDPKTAVFTRAGATCGWRWVQIGGSWVRYLRCGMNGLKCGQSWVAYLEELAERSCGCTPPPTCTPCTGPYCPDVMCESM